MAERADAHIHLFEGSFQGGFAHRPGVNIDEAACYASLATEHDVAAALIVGYAGQPCYANNAEFLARMAAEHTWVRPAAYFEPQTAPDITKLEGLRQQGFVGLSFYIFDQEKIDALHALSDEFWSWLVEHGWLLSVNSNPEHWQAWKPILQRHGDLHLVMSHLGLPPMQVRAPSADKARQALATVLDLAEFPGPRVKLSGFYAFSDPPSDYPHETAWPYVEALLGGFGHDRLLWGSDYTPCLEHLSFPQTFGHFAKMPFLSETQRQCIEGTNLLELLERARG